MPPRETGADYFLMTPRPQPLFWTVTGRDFGRSIAWAKQQPVNAITAAVRAEVVRRKGAF